MIFIGLAYRKAQFSVGIGSFFGFILEPAGPIGLDSSQSRLHMCHNCLQASTQIVLTAVVQVFCFDK